MRRLRVPLGLATVVAVGCGIAVLARPGDYGLIAEAGSLALCVVAVQAAARLIHGETPVEARSAIQDALVRHVRSDLRPADLVALEWEIDLLTGGLADHRFRSRKVLAEALALDEGPTLGSEPFSLAELEAHVTRLELRVSA